MTRGTCGLGIFYRITAEGPAKGMLPEATGFQLQIEFCADERAGAFDFSQPHTELSRAQVEAMFGAG